MANQLSAERFQIYTALKAKALENGRNAALLSDTEGDISWASLLNKIDIIIERLLNFGFHYGDRIATSMENGSPSSIAALAIMSKFCLVPLDPGLQENEARKRLIMARAKGLLVSDRAKNFACDASSDLKLPIIVLERESHDIQLLHEEGHLSQEEHPNLGGEPRLILFTSGTTSTSKAVPLDEENLIASSGNIQKSFGLTSSDRRLNIMPFFHVQGLLGGVLAPLLAGGSIISPRSFSPAEFGHLLTSHCPTWYSGTPAIHLEIISRSAEGGISLEGSSLRFIRNGTSPLTSSQLTRIEQAFGVPVIEAFGMSEAASQIACNPFPPSLRKAGSAGLPAGPEVKILGSGGIMVFPGCIGEIIIRGSNVFSGYEGDAANASFWDDGWFRTGDLGRIDEDGFLWVEGRLKEMINRGGEKVIPRRVDEALLQHPAVEQALAFAVPHPTLGEDLAAAAVLRAGALADEEALRSHALALLAPHEVPSRIVLLPDLPRGATGKLQRIGLAEKLGALLQPAEEPASGELEELVAYTFGSMLQQSPPGRNANFFQLGGDSLSGQRAVIALEQQLALDLSPTLLFVYPTVRNLAEQLDKLLDQALAEAEQVTS